MASVIDYDSELAVVKKELSEVEAKLKQLKNRQQELIERKNQLEDNIDVQRSKEIGDKNWDHSEFQWSERLYDALKNVFHINSFRPQQRSAMNATLSRKHAIVIMPTGAGKSLCYQLPALINDGITVVISPLISLMEDQVMGLTRRHICSKLMCSSSSKEETNEALLALTDKNSTVKLLYVTPERLAKSKRFMAKLQKCFAEGRLQRIAIDEVHCCSQWGHDFRPDYKFLGILSSMFPDIPILGLTATATSRVLIDVQKMLDIRGCLVIKSSFNRPNLFYQIIDKPTSTEGCIDIFESMLKFRYKGQSGIIYATSIKDCEDLTQGLRTRGLKVACYHASLEPSRRSSIHTKWVDKYYQAIIATVAFGLGIDRPDVRFVLHHSLSKSMESYYQESGRAGRDGQRAECIMMYRMQDIFKLSTMVFSSAGSLQHLYEMLRYCLDPSNCRRKIISQHFDEEWGSTDCHKMCDRCCRKNSRLTEIFIQDFCRDIYKIIRHATQLDTKLTAQKLLDSWFNKGLATLRVATIKKLQISRTQGEDVVAFLLIQGYLKEDFHFTAYNTISYIKIGPRSSLLDDNDHKIKMVPKKYLEILDPIDVSTNSSGTRNSDLIPVNNESAEVNKSPNNHSKSNHSKVSLDKLIKSSNKIASNSISKRKKSESKILYTNSSDAGNKSKIILNKQYNEMKESSNDDSKSDVLEILLESPLKESSHHKSLSLKSSGSVCKRRKIETEKITLTNDIVVID